MKYLDRLKSEKPNPDELQKLQKEPSYSFCSEQQSVFSKNNDAEELGSHAQSTNSDREHQVVTFSNVLGREIVVSWTGDNPKVVYVDRTPYATDEIEKLKNSKPQDVRATHAVKETFQGTIVDEDEGHT